MYLRRNGWIWLIGSQFQMSTINSGMIEADYFTKYPTRFFSMHIQDIDTNTEVPGRGGRRTTHPQKPVGQRTINWKATFDAAKKAGHSRNFIGGSNV